MKLSLYTDLVKEWHPTKNGDLNLDDLTHGSGKKVWWFCPKGHSHESVISNRTSKNPTGCPYCSGNKVGKDNNLEAVFPEIAKEWHPTMNGELTPKDFTHGTAKKVWWLCSKGHSFDSAINHRTSEKEYPAGCPYCSGRRVGEDNNLLFLFPEIAKEWHPTKNGGLTPRDVTSKSDKKVWWQCHKGHSYNAIIKNRTIAKSRCPFCSGKKSLNLDLWK